MGYITLITCLAQGPPTSITGRNVLGHYIPEATSPKSYLLTISKITFSKLKRIKNLIKDFVAVKMRGDLVGGLGATILESYSGNKGACGEKIFR
jgi:hypothetical protein